MSKTEVVRATAYTPKGIISYPFLVAPDTGRQYSSNKYTCDFFIKKDVFKKEGKPIVEAILEAAKAFYGKPVKMSEFTHPLKDCAGDEDLPEILRDCYKIRAKSVLKPEIVGPRKENNAWKPLTEEQVKAIKGGDIVRLVINFYPYKQSGGGIAAGLQLVQFIQEGEALGQGKAATLAILEDNEVDSDEVSMDELTAQEPVEIPAVVAAPVPAAKAKAKKAAPAPAAVQDEFDFIGGQ